MLISGFRLTLKARQRSIADYFILFCCLFSYHIFLTFSKAPRMVRKLKVEVHLHQVQPCRIKTPLMWPLMTVSSLFLKMRIMGFEIKSLLNLQARKWMKTVSQSSMGLHEEKAKRKQKKTRPKQKNCASSSCKTRRERRNSKH